MSTKYYITHGHPPGNITADLFQDYLHLALKCRSEKKALAQFLTLKLLGEDKGQLLVRLTIKNKRCIDAIIL